MRRRMVEALVAAKRELHPELRRPLTWARLHAVCRRERVALCLADLPPEHPAQLVPYFDRWSILISDDLSMKERVRLAAHELAHVWAHHDAQHERWELVYQDLHPAPDDPAEREANAVAWLLIEGASELPAEPRPTRRSPAIVVPQPFNPYAVAPVAGRARRQPVYGGRVMETRLQSILRRVRPMPRPMKAGPRDDERVVRYEQGGVVRYVDSEGFRWTLYDVRYHPQRETLSLGNLAAQCRVFVGQSGERRRYAFTRWESRDVAARHLDRQFRDAERVPVKPAALAMRA
jgi:hypothetical protein